jgi:hypothetical protein
MTGPLLTRRGEKVKIRGVNKQKGTTRRWGAGFIKKWPNGTSSQGRWLLKGSEAKGTLKRRRIILYDGEWCADGKWEKVK